MTDQDQYQSVQPDKPEAQSSDHESSESLAKEESLANEEETPIEAVGDNAVPVEDANPEPVAEEVPAADIEEGTVPDTTADVTESAMEAEEEDDDVVEELTIAPAVDASTTSTKWPGQWYVLHTYSGYEDAVAESLHQRIASLDMQDKIFDVLVPKENQIEIRAGKRKTVEKKIFPGYVLVNMNVTEDSWYVVRNTPNVTGFIGSGTVPVPVSDTEIKTILKRMAVEEPKYKIDLRIGDLVHINDGPFKNYDGTVSEVDEDRGKIKVLVSIFGRETPVELDFLQVKKV